jgi:hypothetical protein
MENHLDTLQHLLGPRNLVDVQRFLVLILFQIGERLHFIGRNAMEDFLVELRVQTGSFIPDLFVEVVGDWVGNVEIYHFVFFAQQAQMLLEQVLAQAPREFAARETLPVHDPVVESLVLDQDRDLRVPLADQRAIVDVRRAADHDFVVDDHQLRVDVDQLGDRFVVEGRVGSQSVEGDVIGGVFDAVLLQSPDDRVFPPETSRE